MHSLSFSQELISKGLIAKPVRMKVMCFCVSKDLSAVTLANVSCQCCTGVTNLKLLRNLRGEIFCPHAMWITIEMPGFCGVVNVAAPLVI